MKRTLAVSGLSLRDLLHRKVLYIFAAIIMVVVLLESLSMIMMSRIAPTASGPDVSSLQSMIAIVHGMLWGLGGLVLIVLAMTSIATEVTQGTGVMLLSKCVRRSELYFGKFLGMLVLFAAYGIVASALVFAISYLVRGFVDSGLWRMELAGFVSALVGISAAYAFAAAMSLVPAISLFIVIYILDLALPFFARTNIPVLSQIANALRYVYPGSGLFGLLLAQDLMAPAQGIPGSLVGLAVLHAVDYSAILLLLGAWAFSRRQLLKK